jgi:hypothetical protein
MRSRLFAWLIPWHLAFVSIEDNPLYGYIRIGELRRLRRGLFPRWLSYLIIGICILLAYGFVLWYIETYLQGSSDIYFWIMAYAGLFCVASALWYAGALAALIADCMRLLSEPGKRRARLQIDDMTGLTLLASEEIIAAILRFVLPKAAWPALACSFMVWAMIVLAHADPYGANVEKSLQVFLLGPLTILSLFVSALLSVILLALLSIIVGRNLKTDILVPMSTLASAAYTIVIFSVSMGIVAASTFDGPMMEGERFWWLAMPGGLIVGVLLTGMVGGMAAQTRHFRLLLAAAWPLILLVLVFVPYGIAAALLSYWLEISARMAGELAYGLSLCGALNMFALPSPVCIGGDYEGVAASFFSSGLGPSVPRMLLLLAAQLVAIHLAADNALIAVDGRRSGRP